MLRFSLVLLSLNARLTVREAMMNIVAARNGVLWPVLLYRYPAKMGATVFPRRMLVILMPMAGPVRGLEGFRAAGSRS